MDLYKSYSKYYVAVDCVMFGYSNQELKVLLYPRSFEPYKGLWSLLGAFVKDNESTEDAAKRVLEDTTGMKDIFLDHVGIFSDPGRDSEDRVISMAYYALIRLDQYAPNQERHKKAKWFPITQMPELVFDHGKMVEKALSELQTKAGYSLVGKELLPEMFTLIQLRKLYEAIFQRVFDPGNFRKKILSLKVLEKLDIKDSSYSKKGAFYYKHKEDEEEKDFGRIVKL